MRLPIALRLSDKSQKQIMTLCFGGVLSLGMMTFVAPAHAQNKAQNNAQEQEEGPSPSVIYKGTDAQGRVVLSNNPKVMKNPKKMDISPPALVGSEAYVPPAKKDANKAESLDYLSPAKPTENLQDQYQTALANLALAKKKQAEGTEPFPGERQGTAGGGSRLTPAYQARQSQLTEQVNTAQKEVDRLRQDIRNQ